MHFSVSEEVQCPTLESLESLWNDYHSGHLNEVAERYLVTDEIKRKFNLETFKFKTTLEEENYLICKKTLMEKPGEFDKFYRCFLRMESQSLSS